MSAAWELSGTPLPRRYQPGDSDFFIEPKWVVNLLLDAEPFTGSVLDPACGTGTIINARWDHGIPAEGAEIVHRGCVSAWWLVPYPGSSIPAICA
jgi:hypothetical protein